MEFQLNLIIVILVADVLPWFFTTLFWRISNWESFLRVGMCRGKNNICLKQPPRYMTNLNTTLKWMKWPTVGEFDHSSPYCSLIMFIRNVGPFVEGFPYSAIDTSYTHSYTHFSWAKLNQIHTGFKGTNPHPSTLLCNQGSCATASVANRDEMWRTGVGGVHLCCCCCCCSGPVTCPENANPWSE